MEIPGEVVIEKTDVNTLGIGSYGAVYKAKIGHLPCAAKILHPTLFHTSDPGSDRIRTLFERECRVLRRIRHPHVIQYIKSFQDQDTRLPVLLMELMDESLTHYLERLTSPVPHHMKLNIAHDVSLALEFLHGIGVLHRDLSGNNVLLIAGKRAKVTDFGMAKVWESGQTQMTPATFCPGTMAYMPPEAFKAEPVYTEKLDVFSAGVVYLQVLTRKFPSPSDRVRQVYNDERYPTGIEVIIPERDRREADISLVSSDDPLLQIALDCMHDKAFMRPYATEVCGRIETLKSTSWTEYVVHQESLEREGLGAREEGERENGIDAQHLREIELDETRALLLTAQARVGEVENQLEEKEREVEELKSKLMAMEKEHGERMEALMRSLREKHEMLAIQGNHYEHDTVEEELATRDARIANLERQLRTYKEDVRGREQLSLPLSSMPTRTLSASDVSSFPSSQSPPTPQPAGMRWKLFGTARRIEGSSSALTDSFVYFTDGTLILMFNRATGDWTTLPPCPKHSFSIAVVGGLPTAVGGFEKMEGNSNSLLSLSGEGHHRSWLKTYPAMRYRRTCPATVTAGQLLVVAGGHGADETGRQVEILDMSTMVWTLAAPLPFPLWRASATTCGDRLYLGGGEKEGKPLGCPDIFYCSLSDLQSLSQKSTHSLPSTHKKLRQFKFPGGTPKVWHSVTKLPVVKSTLVSVQRTLFAVGGQNRGTNTPVADVYRFSTATNEWSRCSHMNTPRSRCFAVALDDSQLMALGGSTEPYTLTDTIEIALL